MSLRPRPVSGRPSRRLQLQKRKRRDGPRRRGFDLRQRAEGRALTQFVR